MNKEKDYLSILKLSLIFLMGIIISNIGVNIYFCHSLKKIEAQNFGNIENVIQNLKIENKNKNEYTISIKEENLNKIRKVSNENYNDFLIQYNQNQSNWLNFWLTVLSIVFAFLALIIPICFMKLYQDKKVEIDRLIDETKKQKESMQLDVNAVNKKSRKMENDLESVKSYVNKAESFAKYSEAMKLSKQKDNDSTKKEKIKQLIKEAYELNNTSFQIMEAMAMQVYKLEKNYKKAIELIQEILKTEKNENYYEDLALLYRSSKQYNESIKQFEKAIEHSTDTLTKQRYRANQAYLYAKMNLTSKAKEIADTLLKESSDFSPIKSLCGLIYIELKQYKEATDLLEKEYQVRKNRTDLYNLIEACIFNSEISKALNYAKMYITPENFEEISIYEDDYQNWTNKIKEYEQTQETKELLKIIESLDKKPRDDE